MSGFLPTSAVGWSIFRLSKGKLQCYKDAEYGQEHEGVESLGVVPTASHYAHSKLVAIDCNLPARSDKQRTRAMSTFKDKDNTHTMLRILSNPVNDVTNQQAHGAYTRKNTPEIVT